MAHLSDPTLRVAQTLRVKGFAATEVVAAVAGLPVPEAACHLGVLRDEGHAILREGRISGWGLTPAGRAAQQSRLAAELAEAGCATAVRAAYEAFLELNEPFLAVCTDWQLLPGQVFNAHADRDYDSAVIGRLADIDRAVGPIADALADALARFGGYPARLRAALGRVQSGEHDWFTGAMIDSYHTVWFELHEDLLATLGIERAKER